MINVSIVLYNSNVDEIRKLILAVKKSNLVNIVFIVDNSPEKNDKYSDKGIEYIYTGKNIGFGSGHNLALRKTLAAEIKYHLVLNPDIEFSTSNVLEELFSYMEENHEVGIIMPKVISADGSIQYLPKLLPSPLDLFIRKISITKGLKKLFLNNYELRFLSYRNIYNVPLLSGCFSLFRINVLKEIGIYDERYFMYFEDFDISRRVHAKYKTIYFSNASIIHKYESGANKRFSLLIIFIKSAFKYFNKWGWIIDKERSTINKNAVEIIKNMEA
jgi:GT2 family glycosyltransferase